VKLALRIAGWIYLAGVVLTTAAVLFSYYQLGSVPIWRLPYDLALIILWPVALAFIIASGLGLSPPIE
jgi:hypothetical protein